MSAVLSIAALTITEAFRRQIVWILVGLTVVSVALTGWGVERLVSLTRESGRNELELVVGVSQILLLVAFMFSFVLAMTAAFLGAPAIAADLESGIAFTMLARPIRRADLIIGRWLGLSALVIAYAVASSILEVAVVGAVSGYTPPYPLLAAGYLAAQAVTLLTLAMLLSTRLPAIASGAICVVVFGLGWMAGVFAGVGQALQAGPLVAVAEASRWLLPSDGLWRGTIYGLEPPVVVMIAVGRAGALAEGNPFFATSPPPLLFVAWSAGWVVFVLGLAVASLRRRDL